MSTSIMYAINIDERRKIENHTGTYNRTQKWGTKGKKRKDSSIVAPNLKASD